MLERFQISEPPSPSLPIWPVRSVDYQAWLQDQPPMLQSWLTANNFKAHSGHYLVAPNQDGSPAGVALGLGEKPNLWAFGALAKSLAEGHYHLADTISSLDITESIIGWGLGAYEFNKYRQNVIAKRAILNLPEAAQRQHIYRTLTATYLVRDLINTPAEDMGPNDLASTARNIARKYSATFKVIEGNNLLESGFPAIHTVGRASSRPPCLIDLQWGSRNNPKLTLVGKGVCFDSGGLNLKSSAGMRRMKKDMGGAATVLALAGMIMDANLPVYLRTLIPAVDNALSGNAFRPGDVLHTRKGISVEVGDTDAEGRLILADALSEADSECPDLILDCATLTGSARVALGTDLPALFTNDEPLAEDLMRISKTKHDPLWRLPLWQPYREALDSPIADIDSTGSGRFAGAITAALFLKEFVTKTPSWAHLDIYAWDDKARPGRPIGGAAMALRTLFALLEEHYPV